MTIKISTKIMSKKQLIQLTSNAAKQIKTLLNQRGKPSIGIRIGIKSGGCSGLKYFIEYADTKNHFDEIIHEKGVTILVDPKALMYLLGTQMDFISEQFKSGFVFTNPNAKGQCGCGSSFNA